VEGSADAGILTKDDRVGGRFTAETDSRARRAVALVSDAQARVELREDPHDREGDVTTSSQRSRISATSWLAPSRFLSA